MGELIPFREKPFSAEEKHFRARTATNPNDLDAWTNLFKLGIQEGKFTPTSDYAEEIIRCLGILDIAYINRFIQSMAPIVEALWNGAITREESPVKHELLIKKLRQDTYNALFKEDEFIEDIYHLVPVIEETVEWHLGKTAKSDSDLKRYLIGCFKVIISKHGLIRSLINLIIFGECPVLDDFSEDSLASLLQTSKVKGFTRNTLHLTLRKIGEKYLTEKVENDSPSFMDLYRLFILRYGLGISYSDVCNAILEAVAETDLNEIIRAFNSDTDISDGEKRVTYRPQFSDEDADFTQDLYFKLHEGNKLTYRFAFNAFLIWNPAAHEPNYSLDLLERFKKLLFDGHFLKEFFEAVQL